MSEKWITQTFENNDETQIFINGVPLEEYRQNLKDAQVFLPDLLQVIKDNDLSKGQLEHLISAMIQSGRKASHILYARG